VTCDDACTPSKHTPRCVANTVSTLSGVAESRGWTFAMSVAGAELGAKWRNSTEESLANALLLIADIAGEDEAIAIGLAPHVCKGAARRWRFERDGGRVQR
jgi:hypothetical protein